MVNLPESCLGLQARVNKNNIKDIKTKKAHKEKIGIVRHISAAPLSLLYSAGVGDTYLGLSGSSLFNLLRTYLLNLFLYACLV